LGIRKRAFVSFSLMHIRFYFKKISILQAWLCKISVVSLAIDPDEVICSNGLGFHLRTFAQMVEDIRSLSINDKLRSKMEKDARTYVEREHNVIKNGSCLVAIIDRL
jgi:hypothetical protein